MFNIGDGVGISMYDLPLSNGYKQQYKHEVF